MSEETKTELSEAKLAAGVDAIMALMVKPAMIGILLRNAGWTREEIAEHQADAIQAAAIKFGGLDLP